ncbi:MAG: hypothetical protein ACXAEX_08565 [Promethearchaeota archaeon]|jgi:hypothetical protein
MLEKTQSFDMNDQNYEGIQQKVEHFLLKEYNYSIETSRLGKTLLRINYFDEKIDKEVQKSNRITILQEPERRVYIQVMGQLSDDQVGQLWKNLEQELYLSRLPGVIEEKQPAKEELIQQIIDLITMQGYSIQYNDIQNFLEGFQEKYNRLPQNEEIDSIVKSYIIKTNEDYLLKKTETFTNSKPLQEELDQLLEDIKVIISSTSYSSNSVELKNPDGRKKCPCCSNEGLIHEIVDKKTKILDYPRIYAKKNRCAECGYEWRQT